MKITASALRTMSTALILMGMLNSCHRIPMELKLVSADEQIRSEALTRMERFSTRKRKKLAPKLALFLRNDDSRMANRASEALIRLGTPAIEPILPYLQDPDVFVRLSAISILGNIGNGSKIALPQLVSLLKDAHPLVREESAHAIGLVGADNTTAAPPLIETINNDTNEDVRRMAQETLQKMGIAYTPPRKIKPYKPA